MVEAVVVSSSGSYFRFWFALWPILLLRLNILPFGHSLTRTIVHAQAQAHSFVSQSCIGLGPLLGSGSGSGSYFSLSVIRRMLLFILRFGLKPEQGHKHGHKLDLDMTKKQNMIIKQDFEPEHDPEPLPG